MKNKKVLLRQVVSSIKQGATPSELADLIDRGTAPRLGKKTLVGVDLLEYKAGTFTGELFEDGEKTKREPFEEISYLIIYLILSMVLLFLTYGKKTWWCKGKSRPEPCR